MSDTGIGLMVDVVRAGALLERLVRELVTENFSNDTDVWVLIAISGLASVERVVPSTRTAESISSEFGFARTRVSMSIKRLTNVKLVHRVLIPKADARIKNYAVTETGRAQALGLFDLLKDRALELRFEAKLAHNARKVDLQRVAYAAAKLSSSVTEDLIGLDRRRLSGLGANSGPFRG